MIGKLDNASASYIDPTAKAMRASAENVSPGKADAASIPAQSIAEDKQDTAAELLASKGACKLDISEEGQALAAREKKTLANNKNVELPVNGKSDDMTASVLQEGEITNVVNCSCQPLETSELHYDLITEGREYESLACNMRDIEDLIGFVFEMCGKQDKPGDDVVFYCTLQHLGRALNAYGHKQGEDIANDSDWYLQNLSDRLDMMDERNPIAQRIRDMLNHTMSGRDIDVESDKFQEKAYKTWEEYRTYTGRLPKKEETKSADLFDDKFASYGYTQNLARWQAERDANLIEEMTGEGDGKKEEQLAEEKEINDKALSYAVRHNWEVICQKFVKESCDVEEMLSRDGDPYAGIWN